MTPISLILISMIAFAASLIATGRIRAIAERRGIMDMPNNRSSHATPIPRGGGVAFVAVALVAVMAGWVTGIVARSLALALIAGGILIAVVGWLDDRFGVPASVRFVVQCAAAFCAVRLLGGSPIPGALGLAATLVAMVWAVNLFNFMDGLDGIAATQAICACTFAAISLGLGADVALAYCCIVIAASVAGFFWWNLPPAKIFMGDVGSGTLGFLIAVLALASHRANALGITGWAFLVGPFVVDATCTLVLRTYRGELPWKPHRDHVYQRAARRWGSHRTVTTAYVVVESVLGLYLTMLHGHVELPVVILAYGVLVGAYVLVRALTRGV